MSSVPQAKTAPKAAPTAAKANPAPSVESTDTTPPASPASKSKTEYTPVTMSDGRVVQFAGKKKLVKEVLIDGGEVSVRFDFRNGHTRTLHAHTLPKDVLHRALGHGLSQKVGDETAGEEDIDDMVEAVDDMLARLGKGEWTAQRAAGDSHTGAAIVIRAVAEHTGKPIEFVKSFIQKKLDADKAAGGKLTRAALYASFRAPNTPTAAIISRLESEKAAKSSSGASATSLLAEME